MPRKGKRKRSVRRPKARRRKRNRTNTRLPRRQRNRTVGLYRSPILPSGSVFTLRYINYFILNAPGSAAGLNYKVFSCNSIFQCDVSLGVGQPIGRDELAQFYGKYQVVKSKISVRAFTPTSGSNDFPIQLSIQMLDVASPPAVTSSKMVALMPRFKSKMYGPYPLHNEFITSSYNGKGFWKNRIMESKTGDSAPFSASPESEAYYHFGLSCPVNAATGASMHFEATLTYTVMCSEVIDLPAS